MRVSVSLSDRDRHDWRDHAACREMDPRDFDDEGTPSAWMTCDTCPVLEDCRRDAMAAPELTHGVYRAGQVWPAGYTQAKREQYHTRKRRAERWARYAQMRSEGKSLLEIALATNTHHTTVLNALRKMGAA